MGTTTEAIAEVRRQKEAAVEAEDWEGLARLRDYEKELLAEQVKEFKPNGRGS